MPHLCRDCLAFHEGAPAPTEPNACIVCGSTRTVQHAELADLTIAHVDCDAFYASVEKRDDPSLCDKPLIVGHEGGRGVVTTACYIARRYGVRSAMPMFKATRLCPEAEIKRPDMAKYKFASADIRALFAEVTDLIEPVSIDEAYLDMSPGYCRRTDLAAPALAWLAREVEQQVGVTISIGFSANKFLAKLASDLDKPRGFAVIGASEAKAILAPMSVTKIHGVGAATAGRMEQSGWTTIGQLQALNERELAAHFGKFGHRLAQFVNGQDDRPVRPSRGAKSISRETTFRTDTSSFDDLQQAIAPMCDDLQTSLIKKKIAGRVITLKLKTVDFTILTRRHTFDAPTQRAPLMLEAAAELLRQETDGKLFRLIGIGLSDFRPEQEADPVTLLDFLAENKQS